MASNEINVEKWLGNEFWVYIYWYLVGSFMHGYKFERINSSSKSLET